MIFFPFASASHCTFVAIGELEKGARNVHNLHKIPIPLGVDRTRIQFIFAPNAIFPPVLEETENLEARRKPKIPMPAIPVDIRNVIIFGRFLRPSGRFPVLAPEVSRKNSAMVAPPFPIYLGPKPNERTVE